MLVQFTQKAKHRCGQSVLPAASDRYNAPLQVITVQVGSAIMAGLTNSFLTNPLDVVKTRLQVADPATRPSFMKTASASRTYS